MDEVLIVGGDSSGKSTLAGGLVCKIKRDELGEYEPEYGGQSFKKGVIDRLRRQYQYPERTTSTYIFDLSIRLDSLVRSDKDLRISDIPGKGQEERIMSLTEDWSEKRVQKSYRPRIMNKIRKGEEISDSDEKETLMKWVYLRSEKTIAVVSLHRVLKEAAAPAVTPQVLQRFSKDSPRTALIVTACDLIDYDPSGYSPNILDRVTPGADFFDEDLIEKAESSLPPTGASGDLIELIGSAEDQGVDMFGVSVPAGPDGGVATDNGDIRLDGFGTLVEWLKK